MVGGFVQTPKGALYDKYMGKEVREKVSGVRGIITGIAHYLFGCTSVLVVPKSLDGKPVDGSWYDIGRVEIVSDGLSITPEEVQAEDGDGPDTPPSRTY